MFSVTTAFKQTQIALLTSLNFSTTFAPASHFFIHILQVVLFDYVKPSTQGTTWGLGGTCVNVGCVPKKLMHRAAVIGQTLHDAHHFGWSVGKDAQQFDWKQLVTNTRNHIRMLNFGYKKGLKSAQVTYINGLASFPVRFLFLFSFEP